MKILQTISLLLLPIAGVRAEPEAKPEPEAKAPVPGHSHAGEAYNQGPRQAATLIPDCADIQFPIATKWEDGQVFFNQGVGQLHGFWYYEAERTFREIAARDPECAMAYWGMAMANWENAKRGKEFIAKAVELKENATPRGRLWIEAHAAVLADEPKDAKERKKAYIKALENIIHEFPDDVEAKAFLCVRLWQFSRQGIPISSHEAVSALLEQVFAVNSKHPAHHYRIHLWDKEKPSRALASAAVLHTTAPAIAHMWHMPGHIYDKLKRYSESSWHQEASARVDHRRMFEQRVLPDRIFNYAHNNEWYIRSLTKVGRGREARDFAKGMLNNPMHPKLNHYAKGNSSSAYGRRRLFEVLSDFELWDDLVALCDTSYLPPTDIEREQIKRLRQLGIAWFEKGDAGRLQTVLAECESVIAKLDAEKTKATDEAEAKAKAKKAKAKKEAKKEEKEKEKSEDDIKKARKEAGKSWDKKLKDPREAAEALKVYLAALKGEAPDEAAFKKLARGKSAMARLHLRFGNQDKALELSKSAVDGAAKQTLPLATRAWILHECGKEVEAAAVFAELKTLAAQVDLETAPFKRLTELASTLGEEGDWRPALSLGDDFGDKPVLDNKLGPLAWHPPVAPDFALPDESGTAVTLASMRGRPVLLIFYLGSNCSHCVEQLNAFAPKAVAFKEAGIDTIAISTEGPDLIARAHPLCSSEDKHFPFPLLADPGLTAFKKYRAHDDFEGLPLHGTFLVSPAGNLLWQDIGADPFMDAEFLLKEARRLLKRHE